MQAQGTTCLLCALPAVCPDLGCREVTQYPMAANPLPRIHDLLILSSFLVILHPETSTVAKVFFVTPPHLITEPHVGS